MQSTKPELSERDAKVDERDGATKRRDKDGIGIGGSARVDGAVSLLATKGIGGLLGRVAVDYRVIWLVETGEALNRNGNG